MIDALTEAAHDHTSLRVLTSLSPFASDHVPFIDAGLPAVLTIEGADDQNFDETRRATRSWVSTCCSPSRSCA